METVLDSLVVRLRADSTALRRDLTGVQNSLVNLKTLTAGTEGALQQVGEIGRSTNSDIADAAEGALSRITGSFQRLAQSGRLSFGSLRTVALSTFRDIASSALQSGLNSLFSGGSSGSSGGFFGSFFQSIVGSFVSGRATGGPVFPGRPFLVGERGPELFVPAAEGRIVPSRNSGDVRGGRNTNITINISGVGDNAQLRQSAGQVALAVRKAMLRAERNA